MKVLSSKVVRDMHLFMEPVKYQVNQVVFQEGMKAEYVVFVRKGSFELSRCFQKPTNCHLTGRMTQAPTYSNNQSKEEFLKKNIIGQKNQCCASKERKLAKYNQFFVKQYTLPKKERVDKKPEIVTMTDSDHSAEEPLAGEKGLRSDGTPERDLTSRTQRTRKLSIQKRQSLK